jgi:hypothetical protein
MDFLALVKNFVRINSPVGEKGEFSTQLFTPEESAT